MKPIEIDIVLKQILQLSMRVPCICRNGLQVLGTYSAPLPGTKPNTQNPIPKAVPFAVSTALSYLTTVHSAILIRSRLEYDRGRAYTDSGHVFILAISHAHHFPYDRQIRTHTRALYTLRADTQPVIYMYTLPTTPPTQSAALPGPSCELCTAGYVSARDF